MYHIYIYIHIVMAETVPPKKQKPCVDLPPLEWPNNALVPVVPARRYFAILTSVVRRSLYTVGLSSCFLVLSFCVCVYVPMVLGVRVHGDTVKDVEVTLDDSFRAVPVPALCGVPVLWKKMSGTGGDDSNIRSNIIVRFMVDPDDGFAPDHWQYGGGMGPAPPVVLARKDRLPFSTQEWEVLTEYMSTWTEELMEAEDDRQAVNDNFLTPSSFSAHVQQNRENAPTAFLSLAFPLRSTVVSSGLSIEALNGVEGEVVKFSRDRVGVRFPDRDEPVALKPERLTLVREAPAVEPAPKRQDSAAEKEARAKHLAEKDALEIATRFVDCLQKDEFPEMGDLHLFGVGCEYRTRATEVLAVWQGTVKNGDLVAEELAQALIAGNVRTMFEKLAHKLAASRTPNSTYAKQLIEANFAATEWDDL